MSLTATVYVDFDRLLNVRLIVTRTGELIAQKMSITRVRHPGPARRGDRPARKPRQCRAGRRLLAAAYSILIDSQPQDGLLVLDDMSIQGNLRAVRPLRELPPVAIDYDVRREQVPIGNERQFLDIALDVSEAEDLTFCGDVRQPTFKPLGLT